MTRDKRYDVPQSCTVMETENLKVLGLGDILNRFFGESDTETENLWDDNDSNNNSKKFIIDCAEVHFDTHDLRSGFALYTLVSRIDFLEFLQNMVDTIGDCDLTRDRISQEQIDLLREDIPAGVFINLEV